jgi:pimeloyl-[acyl-carrier protein] methyl ester esterase
MPGMDGTGLLFEPLIAALPASITPIVVRYPGDRMLNCDELLPIALAALPREGSFVLLGESFSGPLAVRVAAMQPAGLVGLILCATFITKPWRIVGPIVRLLARASLIRFALPLELLGARPLRFRTPEHLELSREMAQQVTPEVIASRLRMVLISTSPGNFGVAMCRCSTSRRAGI